MSDASPRFDLPFIVPGQAQKEIFHNEALLRIDAALQAAVESAPVSEPPSDALPGECWLVGAAPSGAWNGKADQLAIWSEGGWRFIAPVTGMVAWNKADSLPLRWSGEGWTGGEVECAAVHVAGQKVVGERQPAVPTPSGGTVIDVEARAAIDALIATLLSHGLTD
jgi:hypothetical protein